MGIKIVVAEGETVAGAPRRFEELRYFFHRRPWTKSRLGYFEKPCVVRRREERLRLLRRRGGRWYHRFPIELDVQLKRTGPNNAMGR